MRTFWLSACGRRPSIAGWRPASDTRLRVRDQAAQTRDEPACAGGPVRVLAGLHRPDRGRPYANPNGTPRQPLPAADAGSLERLIISAPWPGQRRPHARRCSMTRFGRLPGNGWRRSAVGVDERDEVGAHLVDGQWWVLVNHDRGEVRVDGCQPVGPVFSRHGGGEGSRHQPVDRRRAPFDPIIVGEVVTVPPGRHILVIHAMHDTEPRRGWAPDRSSHSKRIIGPMQAAGIRTDELSAWAGVSAAAIRETIDERLYPAVHDVDATDDVVTGRASGGRRGRVPGGAWG
jgi:hypothetical protein